jgi:hypothetical protein
MTFVLVAANVDQVIQVSDRRITGWTGSVLEDAYGKAGHLLCDDASVVYAFTGLAKFRSFRTSTWLMEALQAASSRDARFRVLIEHFAEIASQRFRSDPEICAAPEKHRRLTVMLTGYSFSGQVLSALVSNFQDFTEFIDYPVAQPTFTVHCEVSSVPVSKNPTMIQAIGAFGAMTRADEDELRGLLEARAPNHAVRAKAAAIVADISDRHRSANTVGKRLNTARIDAQQPLMAIAGYESDIVESTIPMLDMVDGRTHGTGLLIGQPMLAAELPVVFPKVHRNAPCPCGSGKKFRFCHRQLPSA